MRITLVAAGHGRIPFVESGLLGVVRFGVVRWETLNGGSSVCRFRRHSISARLRRSSRSLASRSTTKADRLVTPFLSLHMQFPMRAIEKLFLTGGWGPR
jgi:hypothetical protein